VKQGEFVFAARERPQKPSLSHFYGKTRKDLSSSFTEMIMSKRPVMGSGFVLIDAGEREKVGGGYIGFDQNLSEFPRWLWPYIRPADFSSRFDAVALNPQPLPPKEAVFGS
jgi:hypothetical protein